MHGEISNAEMAPAFLNSTDVMEKVTVTTEWMSTNVVSYLITKIFVRNLKPNKSKNIFIGTKLHLFLRMCEERQWLSV